MTQEDKELLIKDLSARLPYGVKGIITYDKSNTTFTVEGIDNNVLHLSDAEECYVEDFKPRLRPMSSMTEEERKELINIRPYFVNEKNIVTGVQCNSFAQISECQEWLNKKMFDYRGLIEKDLALEALEGMYDNKEK